jgi:hypothetical protein
MVAGIGVLSKLEEVLRGGNHSAVILARIETTALIFNQGSTGALPMRPSQLNSCRSITEPPFHRTKSSSNTADRGPEKKVVKIASPASGPVSVSSEYLELGVVLVRLPNDPGEGEMNVGAANKTPAGASGMMKNSIFVKGP